MTLWVRRVGAGNDVAPRMSVPLRKRRLIAFICPVVKSPRADIRTAANSRLFYELIGAKKEGFRDRQSKCLGGL
jgi:hypothetical protein